MRFPGMSAGKESTYNAGDPGSISGLGSSPGERIGYPFQYSWASLVAQTIKNLTAMRETCIQSPNWGFFFPWRRKWQLTPAFLPGEFHGQRRLVGSSPWDRRVRHDWVTKHRTLKFIKRVDLILVFLAHKKIGGCKETLGSVGLSILLILVLELCVYISINSSHYTY